MKAKQQASRAWGTDRPLAIAGLRSYRYKGVFGWIMIGASDDDDALVQAKRSTQASTVRARLEAWNGSAYVPVPQLSATKKAGPK